MPVISIPRHGPPKPKNIFFELCDGNVCSILIFPLEIPVETIADNVHTCPLCSKCCKEQAGKQYYKLLGWDVCHISCWKQMCYNYHKWLQGEKNIVANFCKFVVS